MAQALLPAAPALLPALILRFIENSLPHAALADMDSFQRRLPHRYPEDKWLFLTWTLKGSVLPDLYPSARRFSCGGAFAWLDRHLDTTRTGPMLLRQPRVARIVLDSLRRGVELGHYELRAYAIMANRVHVLLLPKVPPSRLLNSLKGATARNANRVLGRAGSDFWQAESYDHWVRDDAEFNRIVAYIENNPVRAGFVTRAGQYPWSSASSGSGMSPGAAGTSACATS